MPIFPNDVTISLLIFYIFLFLQNTFWTFQKTVEGFWLAFWIFGTFWRHIFLNPANYNLTIDPWYFWFFLTCSTVAKNFKHFFVFWNCLFFEGGWRHRARIRVLRLNFFKQFLLKKWLLSSALSNTPSVRCWVSTYHKARHHVMSTMLARSAWRNEVLT